MCAISVAKKRILTKIFLMLKNRILFPLYASAIAVSPFILADHGDAESVPAIIAPAREDARYTTTQDMKVETVLTAFFLERAHILQKKIAELDMESLIESDFSALDSTRSIFLQSDLDSMKARFAPMLSDHISRGNLHAAFTVYNLFLKRLDERIARIEERLRNPGTFNLNRTDALILNRKDEKWPASLEDADELWEKRLTSEIITELLGENKETENKTNVPAKNGDETHPSADAVAEACEKLRERYSKLRDNLTLEPWEVEEIFLNALTTQYDPHTSFFSKQSMEEFEIMMRNSLCGIGAVLTTEDGYCTIREIMPGSPVERSGKFSVGDRIVAVAPDGNATAMTDVVGMRLNRIVRMLRGEKGVPVTLLVESGNDHSRQVVTLTRDEVKLTEQLASAKIFDVPAGDSLVPVGVITLPSFYGKDRSDKTAFSTSEDVKELLGKLKAAKVEALVLDLRRNGGGYLNEAIDLLELFVGPGVPAVLTQGSGSRTSKLVTGGTLGVMKSILSDKPEWTGPVIVLVSKLSASASEIVAGALQDNRRALIVGDPQTHGKGSVQEVIPFKNYDSSQEASIKLTRSKWYAPSGKSIQIQGVASDIVTPSIYSVLPVGEGDLDRPLPWDLVPSALNDEIPDWLSAPVSPELIEILAENSRRRQAELPEFLTHHRTIAWMNEREKDKSLPLSISERLALRDNDKAFYELVKKEYTDLSRQTGYTKTEIKLDSAIEQEKESEAHAAKKKSVLTPNTSALPGMSGNDDGEDWPDYDVLLREAVRIAADWVDLLESGEARAAGQARSAKAPAPRNRTLSGE